MTVTPFIRTLKTRVPTVFMVSSTSFRFTW